MLLGSWAFRPEASGAKAQDVSRLNVGAEAPTHNTLERAN